MREPRDPLEFITAMEDTYTADELSQSVLDGAAATHEKLKAQRHETEEQLADADNQERAMAERLGAANRAIEQRFGGDWKELGLLFASAVTGLALGYWLQKTLDKRIPWVGLVGVGVAATGALIRTRWSVRGAFLVGGSMLAGGSTVYALTLPEVPEEASS